jgi:hypothetical protein
VDVIAPRQKQALSIRKLGSTDESSEAIKETLRHDQLIGNNRLIFEGFN